MSWKEVTVELVIKADRSVRLRVVKMARLVAAVKCKFNGQLRCFVIMFEKERSDSSRKVLTQLSSRHACDTFDQRLVEDCVCRRGVRDGKNGEVRLDDRAASRKVLV